MTTITLPISGQGKPWVPLPWDLDPEAFFGASKTNGRGLIAPPNRANHFPKDQTGSAPLTVGVPGEIIPLIQSLRSWIPPNGAIIIDGAALLSRDGLAPEAPKEAPSCRYRRRTRKTDRRLKKWLKTISPEMRAVIVSAWHEARRDGRPLAWMLTIRPAHIDLFSPEERQALWLKTYKKISRYFETKGSEFTAVWARECGTDGTGEHWHVLLWLPDDLVEDFERTVRGQKTSRSKENWFPDRNEVDLTFWDKGPRWENGKQYNAVTYLTKAAHPHSTYGRPDIPYRRSGPVLGKRAGVTRNLDPKGLAQAFRARQAEKKLRRQDDTPAAPRSPIRPAAQAQQFDRAA